MKILAILFLLVNLFASKCHKESECSKRSIMDFKYSEETMTPIANVTEPESKVIMER